MRNFEKIAASPEALAAFLASLPVANSPWEREFHKEFCAECGRENCDGKPCLHQNKRNNPLWWLMLETEPEKDAAEKSRKGDAGMIIEVKAAFPLEWGKEY